MGNQLHNEPDDEVKPGRRHVEIEQAAQQVCPHQHRVDQLPVVIEWRKIETYAAGEIGYARTNKRAQNQQYRTAAQRRRWAFAHLFPETRGLAARDKHGLITEKSR